MTERVLFNALNKHGLKRFDPSELVDGKPQKFDPKLHEATFMVAAEGKEDGDVLQAQTKGFVLNGRTLRVRSFFFTSLFSPYSDKPISYAFPLNLLLHSANTIPLVKIQAAKVGVVKNS